MVRPTDVLHMYHDEDDDEIREINQIGRDNKVKNNACWKCGEVGHFARECPSNEIKTQDRYAGKIQHTYTGSTPVTEKMWQELMNKAINATASSMVLANKYKQMKNKVQQTQTTTSGTTAATTSSVKTTQKQYVSTPNMTTTSSPQTSVMKPVGTNAPQNQSKNQNWKGKGKNITTTSKNGKYTGPFTRSKAKDALIQLVETIPENLLSESEAEGEDNDMSDGGETEIDESTSMSLTLMWRSNDQQWVTGQNSILCQSKSLRYLFGNKLKDM